MTRNFLARAAQLAVLAGVLSGSFVAPVMAQDLQALRAACESDVRKLCAGIQPGGGRIQKCLSEKKDQVSDGCKKVVAEQAGAVQQKPQ